MTRTRVRWGRAAGAVVASCLAVAVVGGRAGAGPSGPRDHGPPGSAATVGSYVVVAPGDTLWEIAVQWVGPRDDPRPFVERLIALNHLQGAVIVPGQRLALPS